MPRWVDLNLPCYNPSELPGCSATYIASDILVINKCHSKQDNYSPTFSPKTYNQEPQIFILFFNHSIELDWLEKIHLRWKAAKLVKPLKEKPKCERYYFREYHLMYLFKLF